MLKLTLLYWLAFGLVGLLQTYSLITSDVEIVGKPVTHELKFYLNAFFFTPLEHIMAWVYAQTGDLPLHDTAKRYLAVSAVFFVIAGYGLLVKRYRLVVVAVLLPLAYSLYSLLLAS
jgi:hypothetical protein